MSKIKGLFATPKKAVVSAVCIVVALAALGTCAVFAAKAYAQSSSIGEENARNFAFADAGIDPAAARDVHTEFEFEQGQFVYEVEFDAEGTEYDYRIKASDGSVVNKETETVKTDKADKADKVDKTDKADKTDTVVSAKTTIGDAKEIALADAGLSLSEVIFVQEKQDMEDGIPVYEFEFYTETTEYEYEISVDTGEIYKKTLEARQTRPGTVSVTAALQRQIDVEEAKSIALADAGVSASEAVFTKTKQEYDDGVLVYDIEFYTSSQEYDYEIDAASGSIRSKDAEPLKGAGNSGKGDGIGGAGNADSYIGAERAKSIAVTHAGFSVSEVNFLKAELDHDDGYIVYEIEFYKNGMEYEYKINALTGDIIEYDSERDD